MTEKNKYNVDLTTDQILQLVNEGRTEVEFQGTMTLRPRATYSSETDLAQAGHMLCKIGRAMVRDAEMTEVPEYWYEWMFLDYEELILLEDALRTHEDSLRDHLKSQPEDHPDHYSLDGHLDNTVDMAAKVKAHRQILGDKVEEHTEEMRHR